MAPTRQSARKCVCVLLCRLMEIKMRARIVDNFFISTACSMYMYRGELRIIEICLSKYWRSGKHFLYLPTYQRFPLIRSIGRVSSPLYGIIMVMLLPEQMVMDIIWNGVSTESSHSQAAIVSCKGVGMIRAIFYPSPEMILLIKLNFFSRKVLWGIFHVWFYEESVFVPTLHLNNLTWELMWDSNVRSNVKSHVISNMRFMLVHFGKGNTFTTADITTIF